MAFFVGWFVHAFKNFTFKAVVNYVGGLLASRRVFCWLPFALFCSWSTNSDKSTPLNTRIKKTWKGCCIVRVTVRQLRSDFSKHILKQEYPGTEQRVT